MVCVLAPEQPGIHEVWPPNDPDGKNPLCGTPAFVSSVSNAALLLHSIAPIYSFIINGTVRKFCALTLWFLTPIQLNAPAYVAAQQKRLGNVCPIWAEPYPPIEYPHNALPFLEGMVLKFLSMESSNSFAR